eukprot:GDKJ01002069.1.p1 GENE.GDKJ01002069.1~~GDKJ01002069.1.p1  ORF type:complete len:363 (-),score=62.62 GDKJ01002069.1:108-1166(-)
MTLEWLNDVKVAVTTDRENQTGALSFLFERSLTATAVLAGHAPATREFAALQPGSTVTRIDGLFLSGGSAFGLETGSAIMRRQRLRGKGVPTAGGVVPIIPGACIFDLISGNPVPPSVEQVFIDTENPSRLLPSDLNGAIGAGIGARICKTGVAGMTPTQGGIGSAYLKCPRTRLEVVVVVVVNALGSILDENGQVMVNGGCLTRNLELPEDVKPLMGVYADAGMLASLGIVSSTTAVAPPKSQLEEVETAPTLNATENTTLAVIFTNAILDRNSLIRMIKMSMGGMGRVFSPAFTPLDGDVVFGVSCGEGRSDGVQMNLSNELVLGAMASKCMREAIRNSIRKDEERVFLE